MLVYQCKHFMEIFNKIWVFFTCCEIFVWESLFDCSKIALYTHKLYKKYHHED